MALSNTSVSPLHLFFLLSFYNIEIRYFHKKVLPTFVQQCSKCVQERDGRTANKRQAAKTKHQTQWHPKSNSHAQGLHCSCCYWRVNFTVTLCCCCLQQKQFPERARRTQKYLMSSSSSSLASSLVATGIVFGHLDARDSLDSPRFFNR